MSVKIFFCYAHEDELLLNKLKTYLSPLQWQGLIETWHDRDISAGTEWEEEIKEHLNTAQIIILLVSPDFMASKYCYSVEMKRAVERHDRKEAHVIPVILRHIYWQGAPFGKLQALPKDARPVMSWPDQDEAFFNVAEGIRTVVMQLATPPNVPDKKQQGMISSSVLTPAVQQKENLSPVSSLLVVEKLALFHTLTGHTGYVRSVALSADGQTLVSGSSDHTIKVWNVSTGQEVRTLTGHTGPVWSIALSADGQTLVSGSDDKTIKVWNMSTGQEVRTLTGHTGYVWSVALSADGQTLVSGSNDKTIKVWRA